MKPNLAWAGGAALLTALAVMPASSQKITPLTIEAAVQGHGPVNPHREPNGNLKRGLKNQLYTNNWSGYAVASYQTGQTYSSATATWQVPSVSYVPYSGTSTWEYSVNWIGIGGFCQTASCSSVDPTLIQLGTGQSASNSGGGYYFAWYELLPANMTVIPNPVKPGDIISALLQCTAGCSPSTSQTWVLTMTDQTAGWTWTETFNYQTGMGSAEWVVEAPNTGGTLPLDNYVQANFDSVSANGATPAMSLSANGMVMQDPWGQTSNPSDLLLGQAFGTCWGNGSTMTPCTVSSFTQPAATSPAPAPTDTLAASPSTITAGQSSTLSWSSTNATACAGGNFTASGTSGSAVVAPTATTTYSLSCTGAGGSVTAQTTVHVGSTTTTSTCHGGTKKCG